MTMLPTTATDLPAGIVLASCGQVVRATGTTVTFSDGVSAQCAANGLWGHTVDLPPWSTDDRGRIRLQDGDRDEVGLVDAAGLALRTLVGPSVFPYAAFTRLLTGDHWVPGLLTALRARGLVGQGQTRAIWLGMLGADTPPAFQIWHAQPNGDTEGPEEVAIGKLEALARDRLLVAVLLIDPAPVFGTRALSPDLVAAAVAGLTGPHSLVCFDETNALLRNGQVLSHQAMAIEADLITVGHRVVGTGDSHRAYALAPGLSPLTAARRQVDGPPVADRLADMATSGFHRALLRAVDVANSPRSRSRSLATAGLLAQGLVTLVEDGLLAGIEGGAWAWSITPAWPKGSGRSHPGVLAEDLRQAGLWAPVTAEGGILLLPPVVSSSADVARIIDSLATVLGR